VIRIETGGIRTGDASPGVAGPIPFSTVHPSSQAEPPPPDLDIVSRPVNGDVVVTVIGEVDTDAAPKLRTALIAALDDTDGACVLDLTTVSFLDSAGLAVLVATHSRAKAHRKSLRIAVGSNSPVIRPMEITGLDTVLRLYHTVDEALNALTVKYPRDS